MIAPITILDILDIFLVAFIMFQLYKVIKGTSAFSIFIVIFAIYLLWLLVKALNMKLSSELLGQVMGVGMIALLIVFQQEIRRFLLIIGNRYIRNSKFTFSKIFNAKKIEPEVSETVNEIIKACVSMSEHRTGALIVIGRISKLDLYTEEGDILKARVSADLLETIFFKNSPLHDGAVLIEDGLILAARCPLPVTDQINLPARLGMRHRAAIGMSESTDALIVVVSEESGYISIAENGELRENLTSDQLKNVLLMEKVW